MKRNKIWAALAGAALIVGLIAGPSIVQATTDGYQALKQAMQPVGGIYTTSLPSLSTGEHNELHLDSSGRLHVVQTTAPADTEVAGDIAHDAADSGNPVKIGGIGRATWETAASTAADRVNASFDLYGRARVEVGGSAANSWAIAVTAAANTAATVSKAAGTSSQRHVCTGAVITFASLGAPTPELITWRIRDGATGAGTTLYTGYISLPAVAGEAKSIVVPNLWLVGTAATAMTIETLEGGGANDYLSVSLQGVTIPN